jgi:serine/threonine protein kinase
VGDPEQIGPYRLTGFIGEGGQGIVYRGVTEDGRRVAVKVLHTRLAGDEKARARFLRELDAARRVARFCTAQVLDAAAEDSQPYIVSEYVDGPSLRQVVKRDGPRDAGTVERLAIGTATALAAIHQAGIVHRDLNPANVLLGPDGPRVVDFGISRALESDALESTERIGTPAYMAPELFLTEQIGPKADIFAWAGTIIYAATGEPPFGKGGMGVVMHRILNDEPDLSGLPERLTEVLAAALIKDPELRPDADAVLRAVLGQEPGLTGGHTVVAPTRRPMSRRGLFGTLAGLGLGAAAGAGVLLKTRTETPADKVSFKEAGLLRGHNETVTALSLGTFNGDSIVLSGGGRDRTVKVWNRATRKNITTFRHESWVGSVALGFVADSSMVASGGGDHTIRLWNLSLGKPQGVIRTGKSNIQDLTFGLIGDKEILLAAVGSRVSVWNMATRKVVGTLKHPAVVASCAFTSLQSGPIVVTGCEDGVVRVWNLMTGRQAAALHGHTGAVLGVEAWRVGSEDVVVSCGTDSTVRMWNLAQARQSVSFAGHTDVVRDIAVGQHRDKVVAVSVSQDSTIGLWDLTKKVPLTAPVTAGQQELWSIAIAGGVGRDVVASGGQNSLIKLWNLDQA